MTPERWARVKELFQAALPMEEEERGTYLEVASGNDKLLRQQVEKLLDDHERAGSFIESPVAGRASQLWHRVQHNEWLGHRLGAYRVLSELGQGGMGTVYLGERADAQYRQRVAIKLIRAGLSSQHMVSRFRQERQILASLRHPGIARLLDGGTTDGGQPYLVMEHIEGERIDDYCDRHQLTIGERLLLFRKVCGAVHYAHQNLVIHRDVKPSNILVTADGEPKLLDFGTAKLLAEAEAGAAHTATGLRPMTPEYASPEQLRAIPVSTASDVYSLGVVLYELLCGRRPYQLDDRSSPEAVRVVCEQEPPLPSAAVGATPDDESVPERGGLVAREVAALRREAPERLRRKLAGDLDNIVLMAMRKEPERRYGSAAELAEDLRRFLRGLPVIARKDTWTYRLGKLLDRHRYAAILVTLGALFVLAAAGAAMWQASLATQQKNLAERHLQEARSQQALAEQVKQLVVGMFTQADPHLALGETVTVREVLDRYAATAREDLADHPGLRAELMGTMGTIYRHLGLFRQAQVLLEESLELRRELFGLRHEVVAASLDELGGVHHELGDFDHAERLHLLALQLRYTLFGASHEAVAASLDDLGRVCYETGRYEEAEEHLQRALELRRELLGEDSFLAAESLANLAAVHYQKGELARSEREFRQSLVWYERHHGERHPKVAEGKINLASTLYAQGDLEGAANLLEQALVLNRALYGQQHPAVASSLSNLAAVRQSLRKFEAAEELYEEALSLRRALYANPDHPAIAGNLHNLAALKQDRGEPVAAEELYREALARFDRALGPQHASTLRCLDELAWLLYSQGKNAQAEEAYRRLLQGRRQSSSGGADADLASALLYRGLVLRRSGRAVEACRLLEEARGNGGLQAHAGQQKELERALTECP